MTTMMLMYEVTIMVMMMLKLGRMMAMNMMAMNMMGMGMG